MHTVGSVFVIVVPVGERRFAATSDYGVNGESCAHEDTVSDTAPYTSDLFPVIRALICARILDWKASAARGFA